MAVDQDRLARLLASAAFDARYYEGHIQDRSRNQRPMTFVGAPTWGRINGWPCLKQNAAGEGATSDVVAPVLDTTQAVSFEIVMEQWVAGYTVAVRQRPGNGGWSFDYDQPNNRLAVSLYDAAGVLARGAFPVGLGGRRPTSYIVSFAAGGLTPAAWFNGIPVAGAAFGAGVPAIGANAVCAIGLTAGINRFMIIRCWQGALTSEDCSCLAEQAKLLIGGAW